MTSCFAPVPTARGAIAATLVIVLAVFAAYRNGLDGPFVLDDVSAIVENPTLRSLGQSLQPPADRGLTVTGRPLVNLSLAINHAIGGLAPRGYHLVNVGLHALAALALFGLVRRTLLFPRWRARLGDRATLLAAGGSLVWAVHPLHTSAVNYVVQRAEILVALWYLLTLYAFARSVEGSAPDGTGSSTRGRTFRWQTVAVLCCVTGMATKEVMVSAPLIVLLYDRTFVAGSFAAAWRRRRGLHLLFAATWVLLAWLMHHTSGRGGTAGFAVGIGPWAYALKQCEAIIHYLQLALWPTPLVFDYGGAVLTRGVTEVWPQALLLLALLGGTVVALRRWPVAGFLGTWFFAVLAPTSSFVPLADTMFEHRMYLPLAALATAAVFALPGLSRRQLVLVCGVLTLAFGWQTARRNVTYHSELALWTDTVIKRPASVRAHYTRGSVLAAAGRWDEAIAEHRAALALNPESGPAHNNLGNALAHVGRAAEAAEHYEAALRTAPSAEAHNNLGNILARLRRPDKARTHFEAALRLRPDFAEAHNNLGNLLAQAQEFTAAEQHYAAALRARPDLADAHANLGNVAAQNGRAAAAVPHYEAALKLRPDFADAHYNLATALLELRRWPEAIAHYEEVLRLQPDYRGVRQNLERARMARELFGK